jgi:putative mRNA 3-end processing factor
MSSWDDIFTGETDGSPPVLRPDAGGLYCEAGGFWIDPTRPVETAVVTHAHSDHLQPGSDAYVVSEPSMPLVERRLAPAQEDPEVQSLAYGEGLELGEADVSLHPAGHMLGSAQVRVEVDDEVWVVTGDYKRQSDPTCESFEPVPCDVFVTEATFGLPIYRWKAGGEVVAAIDEWWQTNREADRPSILFCYAVGKAQRVLAGLHEHTDRRVLLHGGMGGYVELYRGAGVEMPPTEYVTEMDEQTDFGGELILAPTSAHESSWMRRFDDPRTGFASGWMRIRAQKRRRGFDAGFVLSDHCDWKDLLRSIRETGAETVVADHGDTETLVRYAREEMGLQAVPLDAHQGSGGEERA